MFCPFFHADKTTPALYPTLNLNSHQLTLRLALKLYASPQAVTMQGGPGAKSCRVEIGWTRRPNPTELWEISENLHHADLTALQRDTQVARWIELQEQERVLSQSATKLEGRPESGMRAASREFDEVEDFLAVG